MKKVIRCKNCANRLYDLGVGFIPNTRLMCGVLCCEVSEDDGCTFGMVGEGGYMSNKYDVDIGGYAAINGCRDFGEW